MGHRPTRRRCTRQNHRIRENHQRYHLLFHASRSYASSDLDSDLHVPAHPCNLAEFTLWGGMSPDPLSMEPLLEGSLKNDANTETFVLPIQIGELESNATTVSLQSPFAGDPIWEEGADVRLRSPYRSSSSASIATSPPTPTTRSRSGTSS